MSAQRDESLHTEVTQERNTERSTTNISMSDENSFANQRIKIVTERLTNFANELRDSKNEDDEFYRTTYLIYIFFGRRYSFLSILNAIHVSAGDVSNAIQLLKSEKVSESQCFNFKNINVADEKQIKRYLQIAD